MASTTYYVALAFTRSEDGDIISCEPKEAGSLTSDPQGRLTGDHGRTLRSHRVLTHGDSALGDFEDAVILKAVGEVDSGLLSG
jgi:hypothetical protein